VELFNSKDKSKSAKVEGLIDTGADCSIIEAAYAHILLDVDYKTGIHVRARGVSGKSLDVYYHEVDMEIVGMKDSKCKLLLGFMESANVGLLLGRLDFFDNFRITFDMMNYAFEIETYLNIFSSRK